MTELALGEDDAPFSPLGFPYAGIEAAIGALKQVGSRLDGVARKNTVSQRAVAPRLRERLLEANNLRHGFRGRTDCRLLISHASLLGAPQSCPPLNVAGYLLSKCDSYSGGEFLGSS